MIENCKNATTPSWQNTSDAQAKLHYLSMSNGSVRVPRILYAAGNRWVFASPGLTFLMLFPKKLSELIALDFIMISNGASTIIYEFFSKSRTNRIDFEMGMSKFICQMNSIHINCLISVPWLLLYADRLFFNNTIVSYTNS